tara:strand:- start:740 stop:1435 length:696 start_codon:yes stop_codon:yes gene_type:complete
MLLFNNKLEMLNTTMIIIIIVFLLICFITNYFKSIENFSQSQYGLVACPPQFTKVGNTNDMYYNGNIGIGVASPTEHLTIADGDARIFLNGSTGKISCADVIMPNLGSVYNRIYSKEYSTIKRYIRKDVHTGASKYADHFVILSAAHRPPHGTRRIGHWTLTAIGADGTTSLYNAGGTIMFTSHSWANVIGGIPWSWTYGANGHIYHNNNTRFPGDGGKMYGEVWYIDIDV